MRRKGRKSLRISSSLNPLVKRRTLWAKYPLHLRVVMQIYQYKITPSGLALFSALLIVVNMTVSPFLLSVGMWGLVGAAWWHQYTLFPEKGWGGALLRGLVQLGQKKQYLALTLLFFVVAISGIWSEDIHFWAGRTRIRLPFLVLPWAFANFPSLSVRQYAVAIYSLTVVMLVLGLGSMLNFYLDADTILSGLGEGQPVPVPRQHIRFSLMMVVAILAGGWLVSKPDYWSTKKERIAMGIATGILFVILHILSVRSALAALYAALGFTVFRYLYLTRQWKQGILAIVFLCCMPVVAYWRMPSLQQRVAYMLYDWQHFNSKDGGENYSDSERFTSLYVGYLIWKEHPLAGVGTGDLERETQRVTDVFFPKYSESPKLPHNQFLYILAATGVLGVLMSLWAFLYPLTFAVYRRFYLFSVFQVVIFVSFLVEYTLETSIGAAFYLFFLLWWMKMGEEMQDVS